jgi:hypothetical protein
MYNVAERLRSQYCEGTTLTVQAVRQRKPLSLVEGLWVGDNWTDVFEPVRKRRPFSHVWTEVQSVQGAASNIGQFVRERPDLANG